MQNQRNDEINQEVRKECGKAVKLRVEEIYHLGRGGQKIA
jgi:hypothetical protein